MKIGDDGYLELEIGGPLRRQQAIARDPKPQHRLDAEPIGSRRRAERADASNETQKMAA
jgi:hypothetical protein